MGVFGFAASSSLKNTPTVYKVSDSPEPLDLDNLIGFINTNWWYVSVSDKTPQYKYKILEENKFSEKTLKEAREFWENKNKTVLFDAN